MVDLVGINVHMSYIHNLKFINLEPPSGYKRNYILMKFHTSVYLEVLNKNFLKSFGGAVGKFPLDSENQGWLKSAILGGGLAIRIWV